MAFVVAHRFGNDLAALRSAAASGVAAAEADVRLYHGRLEVRHLKTIGPIPLLWDRWTLANPFAPRLRLGDLLAECPPDTELLLDLKGPRRGVAHAALRELRPYLGRRRVAVCARSWRVLAPFAGVAGVEVVRSVRTRRALRRFLRVEAADGVSVHADLVDAEVVRALRRRARRVFVWPVRTEEEARRLRDLGVDGLITERLELAAMLREAA